MTRPVQEPVESPGALPGSTDLNHPAFGQISAARVSGAPGAALYGSDFRHGNWVIIRIARSTLGGDISHDWPHAREELIEVWLSEAQWATFVSSMNVGDGPQCTIYHVGGERMPALPLRRIETVARAELDAATAETARLVEEALAAVRGEIGAGLSKVKQEKIIGRLEKLQRELSDGIPWMAKTFARHMETTVEKAKMEVNAYMTHTLQRMGITALGGAPPAPLQLTDGSPTDDTKGQP